jgi:hypothetical protein
MGSRGFPWPPPPLWSVGIQRFSFREEEASGFHGKLIFLCMGRTGSSGTGARLGFFVEMRGAPVAEES